MKVTEIFTSLQGEVDVGMPATFVRLSGCNLCCKWCDSKYANKGKEMPVDYVAKKIDSMGLENVIFTGGEPMLQHAEMSQVMASLKRINTGYNFYLETNGSIYDDVMKYFKSVSCSPKKQASDYEESYSRVSQLDNVRWKFVYENKGDVWWEDFQKKFQIPSNKIWIMPEGSSRRDQLNRMKEVAEYCIEKKYNMAIRAHTLIWGKKRGR